MLPFIGKKIAYDNKKTFDVLGYDATDSIVPWLGDVWCIRI